MKTIWKFQFVTADTLAIEMPRDSQILAVQVQHKVPCIWALVDPGSPSISRRFRIFGTGHSMPHDYVGHHVATYQECDGSLIFHLFEDVT